MCISRGRTYARSGPATDFVDVSSQDQNMTSVWNVCIVYNYRLHNDNQLCS